MRISDWSSDVCSSDLLAAGHLVEAVDGAQQGRLAGAGEPHEDADLALLDGQRGAGDAADAVGLGQDLVARRALVAPPQGRSDERRVGNEGVRTCRSRWSPSP